MAGGQVTGTTGIQYFRTDVQNQMRLLLALSHIMTISAKTGDGNSDVLNC